jgi:hypothetical protein
MNIELIMVGVGAGLLLVAVAKFIQLELKYRARHRTLRHHWVKSRTFETKDTREDGEL